MLLTVLSGVSTHTHTEARAISVSLCLVWLAPAPSPLAGLPVTHRRLAGSPTTHHLFLVSADSSSWSNVLRVMTFSASWGNHPLHVVITHSVEAVSLHFLSALSPSPFASRWLEANNRHLEWPLKMTIPKEASQQVSFVLCLPNSLLHNQAGKNSVYLLVA